MSRHRTTLSVDAWPESDRQAWGRALTPGDLLEGGGPAYKWRPATCRHVAEGYGCWLGWLQSQGFLGDDEEPGERLTADRLGRYIEGLRARVSPATVVTRLVGLDRALAVMAPDADRALLRRAIRRLHDPYAGAASKRKRLRDSRELFDLGLRLMAEAEDPSRTFLRPLLRSVLYRDGLMITFLAARPLRRRNFAGLVLGHHLVRVDKHWWIHIPPEETKTGYGIDEPFPEELASALEQYLNVYRPALLAAGIDFTTAEHCTGPLWISSRSGVMMSGHTINIRIGEHTLRAFGRPVNMHLFRDCAATSIAIRDPENVRISAVILGHRRFATTEKYYNLARTVEATAAYHDHLEHLRRGK